VLILLAGCNKNNSDNPPAVNHTSSLAYIRYLKDASFNDSGNLFINDLTGTNEKRILPKSSTFGITYPNWGPNNTLYFIGRYQGEDYPQIYSVKLDGTDIKRISNCSACGYNELNVSAKTGRLVYRKHNPDGSVYITVSKIGETEEKEIVKLVDNSINAGRYMSWFPDGNKIIYQGFKLINYRYNDNLYTINWDGSEKTQITNNTSGELLYLNPFVSPDGKKIVCTRRPYADPSFGKLGVYIANADGSDEQLLLVENSSFPLQKNGNWSGDGQSILVTDIYFHVYTIKPDGASLKQIISTACTDPIFKNS
jgi:Tol biopolymer transport system component